MFTLFCIGFIIGMLFACLDAPFPLTLAHGALTGLVIGLAMPEYFL